MIWKLRRFQFLNIFWCPNFVGEKERTLSKTRVLIPEGLENSKRQYFQNV